MKRYYVLALVLIAVAGSLFVLFFMNRQDTAETFDLADYQEIITMHPSDLIAGEIHDRKTAEREAATIFIEALGIDTTDYESYWVGYDPNHDVWHVAAFATDPTDGAITFGGCPEALIRSNGELLAVWHSK